MFATKLSLSMSHRKTVNSHLSTMAKYHASCLEIKTFISWDGWKRRIPRIRLIICSGQNHACFGIINPVDYTGWFRRWGVPRAIKTFEKSDISRLIKLVNFQKLLKKAIKNYNVFFKLLRKFLWFFEGFFKILSGFSRRLMWKFRKFWKYRFVAGFPLNSNRSMRKYEKLVEKYMETCNALKILMNF